MEAKREAAEAVTALLIAAEKRQDMREIIGARAALSAIGVSIEERRAGYVWRV